MGDEATPTRWLGTLAAQSTARPLTVLSVSAILLALACVSSALRLELRTSNLDLIDRQAPPVARFLSFAQDFGTPNTLIVVLEGSDPEALRKGIDELIPLVSEVDGVRNVRGRLPGDRAALGRLAIDPYFHSRDLGLFFLFVQPSDAESRAETIAPFVDGVRETIALAGLEQLGIRTGTTGMPQYAIDDRDFISRDLGRLSIASFALVLAIFALAFGRIHRPLMVMAALAVAVVILLGIVAFVPGHLTLLSAFFGSILFGLGVDSGIHIIDRMEELMASGLTEAQAIVEAIHSLAPALTTATLTSSAAFLAMTLGGFKGFAELGLIAGIGLPISLLSMVTLLPALLSIFPAQQRVERSRSWIGGRLAHLQHPVLALSLLALALVGPALGGPEFDQDYLNLEPEHSQAVAWERKMVARSDLSPQFAAFVLDSREKAQEVASRLRDEPTVGAIHSELDLEALSAIGAEPDEELRGQFISPSGLHSVYAYPAKDIWGEGESGRFAEAMTAIDPQVTGMPLLGRYMIERSLRALAISAALSALALLLVVGLDLRDLKATLIAVSPAFLGIAGLLGLMQALGLDFNPLAVMALPVVVGIAVDDGVHLVHRYLREGGRMEPTLAGSGRSVILTSATSLAAFGTLAFADHRGLASFAMVLVLGISAALALSLFLLPWLADRWLVDA